MPLSILLTKMKFMNKFISINPLCEFATTDSESKKKSIIRNQKKPSTFKVAPYSSARAKIKRFFEYGFSEDEIIAGIQHIQDRPNCDTDFKKRDRANSIEALRRFLEIQFPDNFRQLKCTFSRNRNKEMNCNGISIHVAPDIIIRWEEDGKKYIGGIKFHIAKGKPFTYSQCTFAAGVIEYFIKTQIASEDEIVVGEYCLSIDVFGQRVCSSPTDKEAFEDALYAACGEIDSLWDAA